jgi:hypothetical protein
MQISREQRKKKTMVCVTKQAVWVMQLPQNACSAVSSTLNYSAFYCTSIKNSSNDIASDLNLSARISLSGIKLKKILNGRII